MIGALPVHYFIWLIKTLASGAIKTFVSSFFDKTGISQPFDELLHHLLVLWIRGTEELVIGYI